MEDKFFNTAIYNEESRQKAQNLGADYLEYQEGMEILDSNMLEQVEAFRAEYTAPGRSVGIPGRLRDR